MNEIYVNKNILKEKKIKGQKQITDLAKTVDFLSENLYKYKPDRKLKEVTKSLRSQVSVL